MARIDPVPDSRLGWIVRWMKRYAQKSMGLSQPTETINLQAHHRGVLFANAAYMGMLDRWNRLPRRLKRLVHIRVAMRVGCPF